MQRYSLFIFTLLVSFSSQSFAVDFSTSELFKLFGVMGAVIVGLSILTLAVVFERFKNLRQALVVPKTLTEHVNLLWQAGEHEQISGLCKKDNSALANVLGYINQHRHHEFQLVSTGAGDIASIQLRKHIQKAYPLAVVATIAPLAGLLGTVIGMIESFYIVAATGAMGDASILADGIYKALFTTAVGLFVALPALGFHHYFKSKITFYSFAIEEQTNTFISEWFSHNVQPKVGSDAH
ncbi:MotA/TolQ/ExbB proton channel family protein [Algibacillus agarilyticus]|uniref:MotA/TolQ/ExbB proton channel family protein n=1 Tax=Algibacillus agarilyticus TaxID=2234133 RepID=UPI000DCF6F4D|nr:MotA/TolQ/ExbB proton channel family protein [Algibacillus agarilyticus]